MRQYIMATILLAALICMVTCASGAETYYMPDDGTLHDCLAIMSGGDTLIIRDGVYTGDANTLDHSHRPPNGSPEAYTTIKAENTGKAIFDGRVHASLLTSVTSATSRMMGSAPRTQAGRSSISQTATISRSCAVA